MHASVTVGHIAGPSPTNIHTYLAKDHVLSVEMRGGHGGNEELRAVGIGPTVGHAEKAGLVVTEPEVLIGKLSAVD